VLSMRAGLQQRSLLFALACLSLVLFACSTDNTPAPSPLPTQTLIPATATPTPTPQTPTATLPDLIAPGDIVTATPTPTPPVPLTGSREDIPVDLVALAIRQLAQDARLPYESIRLAQVEPRLLFDIENPCTVLASTTVVDDAFFGYRMQLASGRVAFVYHVDEEGAVFRCSDAEPVRGELLAQVDPIAAELVLLARQRLAAELDVSTRSLAIIDLLPVTWANSSLGCPQPDTEYTPAAIDGYRIVLGVGERQFAYHTDSAKIIACPAGDEQLPADNE